MTDLTPMGELVVEVVKTIVGGLVTVGLARWSFKRRLDDITGAAEQAARRSGRVEHHVQDLKKAATPVPFASQDRFREYVELPQETAEAMRTNPRGTVFVAPADPDKKPTE